MLLPMLCALSAAVPPSVPCPCAPGFSAPGFTVPGFTVACISGGAQTGDPAKAPSVRDLGLGGAVWASLADENRDGRSTWDEWLSLESWCGGIVGTPRMVNVETELVLQGLNRDALRDWTLQDLIGTFERLDANGDGEIVRREVRGERLTGEAPTLNMAFVNRTARLLLVETADADRDGIVSADERRSVLQSWQDASSVESLIHRWIGEAKAREPENRNAMSAGVSLHTIGADLNVDSDPTRIDWPDMEAWFKDRDADGDGALDAAEIRMRRPMEGTWKRPTAERRALPPLMPWQRSIADAMAVQARTQQPLLICVNMDGETACDSLAYWRYRDPEFAALCAGYVCLVVSPDDHSAQDHDDQGRRMVSPRLGRVLDPEHTDLEVELYERYFNGRRVAPRHVGVAPDGTVLFDIFLTNDAMRIDTTLAEHAVPVAPLDVSAMTIPDLASYSDAAAREELEARFMGADAAGRIEILGQAGMQPELARLGLRSDDAAVQAAALRSVAPHADGLDATGLGDLVRVLGRYAGEDRPRVEADLGEALSRSTAGRTALAAWRAATEPSGLGRLDSWQAGARLASVGSRPPVQGDAFSSLERIDQLLAQRPGLAGGQLLRAMALLQVGDALLRDGGDPTDAYAEAIPAAALVESPESLGQAQRIRAAAAYGLANFDDAIAASRAGLRGQSIALSDPLVLRCVRVLADSATRRVYSSLEAGGSALTADVKDAILAGRTLLAHPGGSERDAIRLLTLLATTGDVLLTPEVLVEALQRFPGSAALHERYRAEILRSGGAAAVEPVYTALRRGNRKTEMMPTLDWYAGLAEFVAAEWAVGQGNAGQAKVSYAGSLERFGRAVEWEPGFGDSANHYRVLGQAALATLRLGDGDLDGAKESLMAAAELRPESLGLKDGLGRTPSDRAVEAIGVMAPEDAQALVEAFGAVGVDLKVDASR